MNDSLLNRVAVVTGAGRGIGRAIALKLARHGASVVVNDVSDGPAREVVDEIERAGGKATPFAGSVTDPTFGERFVAAAQESFGGLDIIVNNAGYTWDGVIQKMDDEQWMAMLDVHLTAPFRLLRAAYPVIKAKVAEEKLHGLPTLRRVVNISSVAGIFGNAGQVNYASAKAGVIGMTQTLAKEWGRLNVTVNAVAFGLIQTRLTSSSSQEEGVAEVDGRKIQVGLHQDAVRAIEQGIPLGRSGTPEEAAGAVYMLCTPETSYVSGQTLMCTGGMTGI